MDKFLKRRMATTIVYALTNWWQSARLSSFWLISLARLKATKIPPAHSLQQAICVEQQFFEGILVPVIDGFNSHRPTGA